MEWEKLLRLLLTGRFQTHLATYLSREYSEWGERILLVMMSEFELHNVLHSRIFKGVSLGA
jgi:hypothetical protein